MPREEGTKNKRKEEEKKSIFLGQQKEFGEAKAKAPPTSMPTFFSLSSGSEHAPHLGSIVGQDSPNGSWRISYSYNHLTIRYQVPIAVDENSSHLTL
jgi:hypothetical protein